jgi:molecular chaperone DnaJ
MAKDYYTILGISRDAAEKDIKKAYRKLAMKYHPDRNPDNPQAEQTFKDIGEAYATLSNVQSRENYDRFGSASQHAHARDPRDIFHQFDEFFGDWFGAQRGPTPGSHGRRKSRGADLQYNLSLEFMGAIKGCQVPIEFVREINCAPCGASGVRSGSSRRMCNRCGGTGEIMTQNFFMHVASTCPECHGSGEIVKDPCAQCHGRGKKQHTESLLVTIPAGVDTGTRIRLSGKGLAGSGGGPTGDLYVQVTVQPHHFFRREGLDIHCELGVPYVIAALGGEVEIPTLNGTHAFVLGANTPPGSVAMLQGLGIASLNQKVRGDIHVKVNIDMPTEFTAKELKALHALARAGNTVG